MVVTTNLGEFTRKLRLEERQFLEEEWPRFIRGVALLALRLTVTGTPVDTGRARANWQTTVETFPAGELDRLDPSGALALSEGAAAIAAYNAQSFATIYMTNNLPYIVALEEGHSAQAPRGMAEVAVRLVEDAAARGLI